MKKSSLLLLMGEFDLRGDNFYPVITFCPIRHYMLQRKGTITFRFGDFLPTKERGRVIDLSLHAELEQCLLAEAEQTPLHKWLPLAVQQVKWRLSRYLWVKECIKNIVGKFNPERFVLSSRKDNEIVLAIKAVSSINNIPVKVEDGPLDQSSSVIYRCAPYALNIKTDPLWFTRLYFQSIKIIKGTIKTLYEPYGNVILDHRMHHPFCLLRDTSILNRTYVKLLGLLCQKHRGASQMVDAPVELGLPLLLADKQWNFFSSDEKIVINSVVTHFLRHYPLKALNAVEQSLSLILSIMKPEKILLMADQVDASRMLTFVAKKKGVEVINLPHGILIEEYSGEKREHPFVPDKMLAWSRGSLDALEELGWAATVVTHTVNFVTELPFRPLKKEWPRTRVLLLLSEWIVTTNEGREDCAIVDMMDILRALKEVGVADENVDVKYHHGNPLNIQAKKMTVEAFQKASGFKFNIIESNRSTKDLIQNYDILITGITSGIFEAVLVGTPVVLFGLSPWRVGALRELSPPFAKNSEGLIHVLMSYDNSKEEKNLNKLVSSLKEGVALEKAVG